MPRSSSQGINSARSARASPSSPSSRPDASRSNSSATESTYPTRLGSFPSMIEPMREGLPPVMGDGARVLILGSFPSERSLVTSEYYANRRNQFWPLLGEVFGFDADMPYAQRIDAVMGHGVALWDVIHSCRRLGSMDAKIDR